MLISLIKTFTNTLILWINAAWMNMIVLKMYFQATITNKEKWAIPKLFFVVKLFNVTCRFRFLDTISFLKSILEYSYVCGGVGVGGGWGVGTRGGGWVGRRTYLAHGLLWYMYGKTTTMATPNSILGRLSMMTSSNRNLFRVTGPFAWNWWIPLTKASDAELWCFLCSAFQQNFE